MKKPWQIWTAFLLCLAALIMAMLWLSFKTIEMDRERETDRLETEIARRQAELQERISSALYRMDLKLLPLVSQEASRPHYLYEPFYEVSNPTLLPSTGRDVNPFGGKFDSQYEKVPSPLLIETPQFVLLHFQLRADNSIASPQQPEGSALRRARNIIDKPFETQTAAKRLGQAKQFCRYETLQSRFLHQESDLQKSSQNDSQLAESSPVQGDYNNLANSKLGYNLGNQTYEINVPQGKGNKIAIQELRSQMRVNEEFNQRRKSTQRVASNRSKFSYSQQEAFPDNNKAAELGLVEQSVMPVSYTHLTLPTIYSV